MSFIQIQKPTTTETKKEKDIFSKNYNLSHIDNSKIQEYDQSFTPNNNSLDFNFLDNKPILQAKLKVSQAGDEHEREADRVAEGVMRISPDDKRINRKCRSCEENEREDKKNFTFSRKPLSNFETSNEITNENSNIFSNRGSPLDTNTKNFMESRFGYDFSQVRIHDDKQAAESAEAVNALAFTVGRDIAFGAKQYDPNTSAGKKLLAHELIHVIQQNHEDQIPIMHLGVSENSQYIHAEEIGTRISAVDITTTRPQEISRQPNPLQPLQSPLTITELFEIITRERAFTFNRGGSPVIDPRGQGRGVGPAAGGRRAGNAVFAVIQVTDRFGNLIDITKGSHMVWGAEHAEAGAIAELDNVTRGRADTYGGKMTVVLDQLPCPPGRADCMGALRREALRRGMGLEVYVPERPSVTRPGVIVRPRTATMGSQRTDLPTVTFRRIDDLYIHSPPTGGPPSSPSTRAASSRIAPAVSGNLPSVRTWTGFAKNYGKSVASSAVMGAAMIGLQYLAAVLDEPSDRKQIDKGIKRLWPQIQERLNSMSTEIENLILTPLYPKIYGIIKVEVVRSRAPSFSPTPLLRSESAPSVGELLEVRIATDPVAPQMVQVVTSGWEAFTSKSELTFSFVLVDLYEIQQKEIIDQEIERNRFYYHIK